VLNDRLVKAAFATRDRILINAGFEQARQIVVYEISTIDARECDVMSYQNGAGWPEAHGRNGKCGPGGGGGCGGSKKKEEPINESEIVSKVASLAGISVLFVNKSVHAFSGLELNEARIFTIKIDNEREIADVITRLQEMLRGDPPLWLRRALVEEDAPVEA
jgi:nitrogen fixation protein NifX